MRKSLLTLFLLSLLASSASASTNSICKSETKALTELMDSYNGSKEDRTVLIALYHNKQSSISQSCPFAMARNLEARFAQLTGGKSAYAGYSYKPRKTVEIATIKTQWPINSRWPASR